MSSEIERLGGNVKVGAAELMETSHGERIHRMLGRLLQAFPEESIKAHAETIHSTLDGVMPHTLERGVPGRTYFGLGRAILHPDGQRPMVVVEYGSTGKQTVFYRSNSHATWRAMLAWAHDGYIAKGMFGVENSADAPIPLQKALSEVAEDDAIEGNEDYNKVLFALTHDSQHVGGGTVADKIAEGKMHGAWMETSPDFSAADIASGDHRRPFVEGKEPVLGELSDAWTSSHPLYGSVTSRVYPSADGTINYMVNSASYNNRERNQFWMGTAEVAHKPVTGLGLTRNFVEIPARFLSPPIDYAAPNSDHYGERRWKMTDLEEIFFGAGIKADL